MCMHVFYIDLSYKLNDDNILNISKPPEFTTTKCFTIENYIANELLYKISELLMARFTLTLKIKYLENVSRKF